MTCRQALEFGSEQERENARRDLATEEIEKGMTVFHRVEFEKHWQLRPMLEAELSKRRAHGAADTQKQAIGLSRRNNLLAVWMLVLVVLSLLISILTLLRR